MFKGLNKALESIAVKSFGAGYTFSSLTRTGNIFSWAWGGNKNKQLVQGYRNKIVYSVVNIVVGKLIEVPQIVSQVKPDKQKAARKWLAKSRYSDYEVQTGLCKMLQVKAIDELESHSLIDLLEKPNDYQTGIELRKAFWFNNKLAGDGYLWAERAVEGRRAGQPIALHSLPADRVYIFKNLTDWRQPVLYYRFTTWTGQVISIPPEEIMHMARWSPLDPQLGGYSPQNAGAKTISISEANMEAQGAAYRNGSTGIIISSDTGTKGNGQPYHKLAPDQISAIKDTLAVDYKGTLNHKQTSVVNGKVEVNKLGDTLADLQMIEADHASWRDICALYNVSPILLGDTSASTESNVKAAYKALVTNSTIPDLREFDLKFKIFSKDWYGEDIIAPHDITEFTEMAPDLKLMKEVYGDANFLTQNEKRKIFNMDEDTATEGMDTYLVASGLMPFEQLFVLPEPTDPTKQYDYQ